MIMMKMLPPHGLDFKHANRSGQRLTTVQDLERYVARWRKKKSL